jgi:hypothetical protein
LENSVKEDKMAKSDIDKIPLKALIKNRDVEILSLWQPMPWQALALLRLLGH